MEASGNWQTNRDGVVSRAEYLLESGQWSDCKFVVGEAPNRETFEAHKLFLAMSSPVFERMFYGSIPESEDSIAVTDVQPDTFRTLLRFIYTDRLKFDSFDDALELYYCAKKYMLPRLAAKCTYYVDENLLPCRVCRVFEFARLFEEPALLEKCLHVIRTETTEVIRDESWKNVHVDTIAAIFDEDTLHIDTEIDLYEALLRWACAECQRRSLSPCDPTLLRSVIGDVIGKIRFLTLTPQQFAQGPGKTELLTKDEAFAIIMNISSDASGVRMPEGFTKLTVQRLRVEPPLFRHNFVQGSDDWIDQRVEHISKTTRHFYTCTLKVHHRSYCLCVTDWTTDCVNHNVLDCASTFKVDSQICILGVQVPTRRIRDSVNWCDRRRVEKYKEIFYAYLDSDGSRIAYAHYTTMVTGDSHVDINFNQPVNINSNQVYRLGVVFNNTGTYPIGHCNKEGNCDGVTFTFGVGRSIDNVRAGLIRAVIFTRH